MVSMGDLQDPKLEVCKCTISIHISGHILWGWLVVEPYPFEKYEFVSWDDYSQYMKKIMFQTTTQKWFQGTRDSARYSPFDSSGATVAAEVALGRGTTQRLTT